MLPEIQTARTNPGGSAYADGKSARIELREGLAPGYFSQLMNQTMMRAFTKSMKKAPTIGTTR